MAGAPIAVVGMGLAVPQASCPTDYWRLLNDGTHPFTEPGDRFNIDDFFSPEPTAPDCFSGRVSGYLHDFRPDPALAAEPLDPTRARPTTWLRHSLLQAMRGVRGHPSDRAILSVAISPLGVPELENLLVDNGMRSLVRAASKTERRTIRCLPWQVATDAARNVLPDDTEIIIVDTACSAGMSAIDLGMRAIWHGGRTLAVCGGSIAITPLAVIQSSKAGGQSRRGHIRPFDRAADGVLFADGAAVVVLKTLRDARRDGDPILGVLLASGIANDGRGKVMNAPNPAGQSLAMTRALLDSGIDPAMVGWVVAHGTGTPLGDVAEVTAINSAYSTGHRYVTSNKAVIGHGSSAAGPSSLIHVLLALQHQLIPAQRYHDGPAPELPLAGRVTIPTRHVPWPATTSPRVAAVNGFGVGGTNVHLLVADRAPETGAPPTAPEPLAVIAWAADLPGRPPPDTVANWLRGRDAGPPLTYQPTFPPVQAREFRIPPAALRVIDRAQIHSLRLYQAMADPFGDELRDLRDVIGVFAGHCGPTRAHARYALRCHLRALGNSPAAGKHWAQIADHVRNTIPATNPHSLLGTLTNTIAARVANHFDLLGPAIAVDAGPDTGLAALRTAQLHLASGVVEVAFVVAVGGGPELVDLITTPGRSPIPAADGAFALLVTRVSIAADRRWPVLAELRTVPRSLPHLKHDRPPPLIDRSYPGVDSLVALMARELWPTAHHVSGEP